MGSTILIFLSIVVTVKASMNSIAIKIAVHTIFKKPPVYYQHD
jgi:hypothetical protein